MMRNWLYAALALFGGALLPSASAADAKCTEKTYRGIEYHVCRADLTRDDLRLFWANEQDQIYGHFRLINDALRGEAKTLGFAMNAGMYHDDRRPVGLYLERGKQAQRLITAAGPGNFGLLPNGVFCIADQRAVVIESRRFAEQPPECSFATQSGPMLVIDGALHPRFLVDSTSRFIRNGVGVSADGQTAIFALSRRPVTFHEFGTLFKDALGTPNALYFDGNISRLYAPELGQSGAGWRMGPVVGLVVDAQ